MTQGFLLSVTMPRYGMTGLFIAPETAYRRYTSNKFAALRYATKRAAFAAAMALTEARLVPSHAIVEPVALIVEGA